MPHAASDPGSAAAAPYILVNTFVPKPGRTEDFLAVQIAEIRRLGADAQTMGWLGNEVYRAHDDASVVIVTRFESLRAQQDWARRPDFAEHLERLRPMLEEVRSVPVTLVHSARTD